MSGYYLSNRAWVMISSAQAAADPVSYSIAAWSDPAVFGNGDVQANVKHFIADPPATGCS